MKHTISIHRGAPVGDQVAPEVSIVISTDVPALPPTMLPGQTIEEHLAPLALLYQQDAQLIAHALRASLPGGTFDRLVCELLTMTASHFRVPWGAQ